MAVSGKHTPNGEISHSNLSESDLLFYNQVKESADKDFEERLRTCQDDFSRVHLFRQSFQWVPKVYDNLGDLHKNANYSTKLRESANKHYKARNIEQALRGYNLAIVYAPNPKSTERNSESKISLSLAFANRSAVWMAFHKYEDVVRDIQHAFKNDYPEHLRAKLEERRTKCEQLLEEQQSQNKHVMKETTDRRRYKEQHLFRIQNSNPLIPAAESFVEIQVDPLKGRKLIITDDVPAGTVLIVEEPFTKVLQKELKWDLKHCHFCFKTISAGVPCPGCVFAIYCDDKCVALALEQFHSYECPCMPYFHTTKSSAYTRMAFRIICTVGPQELYKIFRANDAKYFNPTDKGALAIGCDPETGIYDSASYLSIHHLISHSDAISTAEKFTNTLHGVILSEVLEEFTEFYADIEYNNNQWSKNLFKDFVASMILHHLERVPCNGISLSDMDGEGAAFALGNSSTLVEKIRTTNHSEFGGAVYAVGSLLNHSCCPNVTRIHDISTGKMSIVATMNLRKGDELMTTYSKIFFHHDLEDRREYLEKNFNFTCDCTACTDNWSLLAVLENLEPQFCCNTCEKYILDSTGLCKNCGRCHDLSKLKTNLNHQIKCFYDANELLLQNLPLEAVELLISCIKFLQNTTGHPNSTFVMAQDLLKQAMDLIVKFSY